MKFSCRQPLAHVLTGCKYTIIIWNNLILEHFVANIYLRRAKDDAAVASSIENKRISAQV